MKLCIHTCVRLRALPTYHSYGTTVLLHGTTLPQFAASACTKPHYMKAELIKRKVKSQKRTPAMPKTRHTCIGSASYTYRCVSPINTIRQYQCRFSDAPRLHAGYSFLHTAVTHQYDKTMSATPFLGRTASSRSLYIPLCATHEYDTTITAPPLLETAISATPIPAPPHLETAISTTPLLGRTAS